MGSDLTGFPEFSYEEYGDDYRIFWESLYACLVGGDDFSGDLGTGRLIVD